MVGVSGTSKSEKKHCYYTCMNKIKHKDCAKKPARQDFIESIILEQINTLLHDSELFDFIVSLVWDCYQQQDQTQTEIHALELQLTEADKAINNLVRIIEAGVFSESIQKRISELEAQKTAIRKSIAEIRISEGIKLTEERVRFFLERFRDMDFSDRECQKRLVKTL